MFFINAQTMIAAVDSFAKVHNLIGKAATDHLCYKCGSAESFEAIRRSFEHESVFVYQSIISQRRIAIIRFREPISTVLGPISVLELSDQKPDGSQKEGFDHIEIYPIDGSTKNLVAHIRSFGTTIETVVRPHHTTHDIRLPEGYLVRIEDEPLLQKIIRDEMR